MLGAYTSQPKLTTFVKAHLDPNYTVDTGYVPPTAVVSMANVTGRGAVHKLRKRLKTEFGTVRPPRACNTLQPIEASSSCTELLQLLHPLYVC